MKNKILEEFEKLCVPHPILNSIKLAAAGGDRSYYRLSLATGGTVIGVVADNEKEAEAFCNLSSLFRSVGIDVPEIYAHSKDFKYYIQQDLGDISLFSLINESSLEVKPLLIEAIKGLVKMQTIDEKLWMDKVAFKPFSERLIFWDLNYFKYEFLKPLGITFDEDKLEDDFIRISEKLLSVPDAMWGFQMRDCQSRNIMIDKIPYFIDFQGGRFGPCIYDIISLLWQAKASFPLSFKKEMLGFYARIFGKTRNLNDKDVLKYADVFLLFRNLQVLGAYGFRGLIQHRAHFIESIPLALNNLRWLMSQGVVDPYPELKDCCRKILENNKFLSNRDSTKLNVKIYSFSYKKGYPEDLSGNGGGFMFDCRWMHNPGRYEEYKKLTGNDREVIDFLESKGEVQGFVSDAFAVISNSIDRYIKRGFTSLQIGFGCTGGQHRSVYCANKMAEMISEHFPEVRIELIHREQNIN